MENTEQEKTELNMQEIIKEDKKQRIVKKKIKPHKIKGTNKFDIDEVQVEKLASRFWKITEIASFFNVDEGTIRKRFPNLLIKGKELGKGKLRDLQIAAAMKGNVVMLIWLGKQELNQRDRQEIEHTGGVKIIRDDIN